MMPASSPASGNSVRQHAFVVEVDELEERTIAKPYARGVTLPAQSAGL
jgi:hypothetical protein